MQDVNYDKISSILMNRHGDSYRPQKLRDGGVSRADQGGAAAQLGKPDLHQLTMVRKRALGYDLSQRILNPGPCVGQRTADNDRLRIESVDKIGNADAEITSSSSKCRMVSSWPRAAW